MDGTDSTVRIFLLDKSGNKAARKDFNRLLQAQAKALSMGILSDEYLSLTYLDMGGNEIYYQGNNYPIKLVELDQDNLSDTLDTLSFLVIDSYNTGVLSDKELESIERWLDHGGVLLIGTGNRTEDILRGLDDLEIECSKVYEPGEDISFLWDASYSDVDISQLHMAELIDRNDKYEKGYYDSQVFICSWGDGAVGIFPYSFSELGELNAVYEAYADFSGRGYPLQSILGGRISQGDVKPDIAAPGTDINTIGPNNTFVQVSGTSFATPFVTGSAALMMEWGERVTIWLSCKNQK